MMRARRIAVQVHAGPGLLAVGIAVAGACLIVLALAVVFAIWLVVSISDPDAVGLTLAFLFFFAYWAAAVALLVGLPLIVSGGLLLKRGREPRRARWRAAAIGGGGAVLVWVVAILMRNSRPPFEYMLPLLVLPLSGIAGAITLTRRRPR
jgi:hypothetical protein